MEVPLSEVGPLAGVVGITLMKLSDHQADTKTVIIIIIIINNIIINNNNNNINNNNNNNNSKKIKKGRPYCVSSGRVMTSQVRSVAAVTGGQSLAMLKSAKWRSNKNTFSW